MRIHDDLLAPEVLADPYPYFHQLRAEDPVHWNELWGGWIVTRYDDVVSATKDYETFSSARGGTSLMDLTAEQVRARTERQFHRRAKELGYEVRKIDPEAAAAPPVPAG